MSDDMIVEAAMRENDHPHDTFDTRRDALLEAIRRSKTDQGSGNITKVLKSAYGGYKVRTLPAEFMLDLVADGIPLNAVGSMLSNSGVDD